MVPITSSSSRTKPPFAGVGKTEEQAVGAPLFTVLPGYAVNRLLDTSTTSFSRAPPTMAAPSYAHCPTARTVRSKKSISTLVCAPLLGSQGEIEGVLMSAFDVTIADSEPTRRRAGA